MDPNLGETEKQLVRRFLLVYRDIFCKSKAYPDKALQNSQRAFWPKLAQKFDKSRNNCGFSQRAFLDE